MKIFVHDSENNKNVYVALPSSLVLSGASERIVRWALSRSDQQLNPEQISKLFEALRRCRKQFPKMYLVEVDAQDGTKVRIRL